MGEVIPTGPKAERPQKVRDERRLLLKDDEGSSVSVSVSDDSDKNTEVGRQSIIDGCKLFIFMADEPQVTVTVVIIAMADCQLSTMSVM